MCDCAALPVAVEQDAESGAQLRDDRRVRSTLAEIRSPKPRGTSDLPLELTGEMEGGVKPENARDLLDRLFGVGQQIAGTL